jgi:hypothetical protein
VLASSNPFWQTKAICDSHSGPPIPSATIPLAGILTVISLPACWYLVCELASGDQLMVREVAERDRPTSDPANFPNFFWGKT